MNNAVEARRLLRAHRYGALSTLSKKLSGYPFGSITPYMVDHDGSLVILISDLAEHTKNIEYDPRVSLITHNQSSPEIQMQGRVTLAGNAQRLTDQQTQVARYLRHFPEAEINLSLPGFIFYRIEPVAIRYIGGVGRIHWVRMENYAIARGAAFARQEDALIENINAHQADQIRRQILQYHGIEAPDACVIGLDCDGMTVRSGDKILRLDFTEPLTDPLTFGQLPALSCHTI
ncbi:MAG: pyridoxamine 5'-phosphate oxidase family protein [Gallionella sp.]|nr:pyridoxamine 5'-phosphate oxidase family protein [Gallionella sp.]